MTTPPVVRNALNPSPSWRRVLFTVLAVALVGSAVALQPVAHEDTGATPTPKFQLLATVPLEANRFGNVTINRALNKIYTSGRPADDQDMEVIDGVTFAQTEVGIGSGPVSTTRRSDIGRQTPTEIVSLFVMVRPTRL